MSKIYYTENDLLTNDDAVISVSELNKQAKAILEKSMPITWISGEVSGLKTYAHLYFDLKDENSKISCVMFSSVANKLGFKLENGTKVEIRGKVTIYPVNGSYQINVERVRQVGLGDLWIAYAKLLEKLKLEGLFDAEYKKPLPVFPRAIGVVTSKEGSVIRDVITTLKRRMPNIPIIVYHSAVQGKDAGMQLVKAIRTANQRNEVDVLIVCRGGGSMEDLWCFNEESVAREVFISKLPIISAVGHETDTTIIDFVADLRAPTPTAAAELVATSRQDWLNHLAYCQNQLTNKMSNRLNDYWQRLDLALARLQSNNPIIRFNQDKQRIVQAKLDLSNKMQTKLAKYTHNLELLTQKFTLLNPENVLKRGYAMVRDTNGHIITSEHKVKHHARIEVTLSDGSISAIVDKKHDISQQELL